LGFIPPLVLGDFGMLEWPEGADASLSFSLDCFFYTYDLLLLLLVAFCSVILISSYSTSVGAVLLAYLRGDLLLDGSFI